MSLYLDAQYLQLIRNRLPHFVKKAEALYNCRCPLCGDSAKNERKARAYFYAKRNSLWFKCHNCGEGRHFSTLLKELDSSLYKQYVLAKYADGEPTSNASANPAKALTFTAPAFTAAAKFERLFKKVSTLPRSHIAAAYCTQREIPENTLDRLFYVEDLHKLYEIAPHYKGRLDAGPPRLGIPFYNTDNELTGITLRSFETDAALRYIMVKIEEDSEDPLVFGLQQLNRKQDILVVEGALDSLFVMNAIACNGSSFNKIDQLGLPMEQVIVVIDNQPRNREVCRLFVRYITLGFRVCIWPPEVTIEKDINEMVLAGYEVDTLIRDNIYSGLAAHAAFNQWKKII